jgi:hypothetical protein
MGWLILIGLVLGTWAHALAAGAINLVGRAS